MNWVDNWFIGVELLRADKERRVVAGYTRGFYIAVNLRLAMSLGRKSVSKAIR